MPRIHNEPQALTLHKRVEALTKRVEKLDREVFKAIRIDAENCMPPEEEIRQQAQTEVRDAVRDVITGELQGGIRLWMHEEVRNVLIQTLVNLGLIKVVAPEEPAA